MCQLDRFFCGIRRTDYLDSRVQQGSLRIARGNIVILNQENSAKLCRPGLAIAQRSLGLAGSSGGVFESMRFID